MPHHRSDGDRDTTGAQTGFVSLTGIYKRKKVKYFHFYVILAGGDAENTSILLNKEVKLSSRQLKLQDWTLTKEVPQCFNINNTPTS
jgi:hypothetical protein